MQEEGQKQQNTVVGPQWEYRSGVEPKQTESTANSRGVQGEISWTASEYVAHQKGVSWYMLLGLGAAAASILVYVLTQDLVSSAMILIVAIMFGIFAARQPKVLSYQVGHNGVQIGDKFYAYSELKSFSVVDEGMISSITLMPLKRLAPDVSMYYPPDQEDKIVEVIAHYLPHEERSQDPIDRLMRRVRF